MISLNEFEVIEKYFTHLTPIGSEVICGIGDDGAVIKVPDGFELVVSVDTLVSNVHFFPNANAYDLGYKLLAVNISDIIAMAATPKWVSLSLTLPEIDDPWLQEFTAGFSELANKYSISLVGGDLSCGPLSLTAHISGICREGKALKRSGAKVGDDIFVSGYPGAAGYALSCLSSEYSQDGSIPKYCRDRLYKPEPRVLLGEQLEGLANSAIDISDGLASDLEHIIKSSKVGASVILSDIPLREEIKNTENENKMWETVLCIGDDYEICFTAPISSREKIAIIIKEFNYPVTRIGRIEATNEVRWMLANNVKFIPPSSGYRHF